MKLDNNYTPFYSKVRPEVEDELNFRKLATLDSVRNTEYNDWLLAKTSWAKITMYETDNTTIRDQLGVVSTGDYVANKIMDSLSGRPPASIRAVNINLADTSYGAQGLLNDAQVEIIVPDPVEFAERFDETWLRLGYAFKLEIGHSVRTGGVNSGEFNCRLTDFNFEYQVDGTVVVIMYFKSTTEIFTHLPINKIKVKSNDENETQIEDFTTQLTELASNSIAKLQPNQKSLQEQGNYFTPIDKTFDKEILSVIPGTGDGNIIENITVGNFSVNDITTDAMEKYLFTEYSEEYRYPNYTDYNYIPFIATILNGPTIKKQISANRDTYVSLGALITLLNAAINNVHLTASPAFSPSCIVIHPKLSQTRYLPELVSANMKEVVLPGSLSSKTDEYPIIEIDDDLEAADQLAAEQGVTQEGTGKASYMSNGEYVDQQYQFYQYDVNAGQIFGQVANILISKPKLNDIFDEFRLDYDKATNDDKRSGLFTINNLISRVCKTIYANTGEAINLRIAELPSANMKPQDPTATKYLVLHDVNNIGNISFEEEILSVPLFMKQSSDGYSSRQGAIVSKFKLTGKLPETYKSLMMVLSQTSGMPAEKLGPLLNYIDIADPETKLKAEKAYIKSHETAIANLKKAKSEYLKSNFLDAMSSKLREALKEYVAFAEPTIKKSFDASKPLYPLDVEITLDGIYGFRFGDILQITGLPARYDKFIFTIIQIKHVVENNQWLTTLQLMLRPRI